MKQHSKLLRSARRRIPLFPLIPLLPIGLVLTNATLLVTMFRRLRRLEHARGI
ncbi:MAG: hypothetical protein JWM74_2981 [Myxococcaceae bacterium]|nr:hypothetical protein [Myxococcaceae bacterium]